MRFRSGINTILKFLFIAINAGFVGGLIVYGYAAPLFNLRGLSLVVVLYFVSFSFVLNSLDGLRIGISSIRELYPSFVVASVIVNVGTYLVLALVVRGFLWLWPFAVLQLLQLTLALGSYYLLTAIYQKVYPIWEIIVVSSNSSWEQSVVAKFQQMRQRYLVVASFTDASELSEIVGSFLPGRAVLLGNIDASARNKLIELCYESNTRFFVLPDINDLLLYNSHLTVIDDSPCLLCKNRGFSAEQLIFKRVFDFVCSVILLLLFLPIGLIISVLILLIDGRPIFFRQCRITRDGSEFNIIKFRSMCVDAERLGPMVTMQNDSRVTKLGRFLRRTHLDEWPQLLNVLAGQMSLVGPRAERKENYEAYAEKMPQFRFRTKVKAGMTGFAQVYGRYNTSYEDKLKLDLTYIESSSIVLDLKILVNSIKVLFWSQTNFEEPPYEKEKKL